LRHLRVDLLDTRHAQPQVDRLDVVIDVGDLVHSRDRHDPRFLRQQPSQDDLHWGGAALRREELSTSTTGMFALIASWVKRGKFARRSVALSSFVLGIDGAGQEAGTQRPPWHEADAQFFAARNHFGFRFLGPDARGGGHVTGMGGVRRPGGIMSRITGGLV